MLLPRPDVSHTLLTEYSKGRGPIAVGEQRMIWFLNQVSVPEARPRTGNLLAEGRWLLQNGGGLGPRGLWGLPSALALGAESPENKPSEN